MQYQSLFEPVRVGKVEIPNRFAMCAMGPMGLGDKEGGFSQRGIDYYVERAKGGTGLIITGVTHAALNYEIHAYPGTPSATMNPPHFIRTAHEMCERIHAYGSAIFLQISAGFGRVYADFGKVQPISASPIMNRFHDVECRALTVEEIHDITRCIGEAAKTAQHAGFDGVQIHAVHEGYLLDQFAIAFTNHRTDEYGGSLENRLRFAREVVEEIKRQCGEDFPVSLRYTAKSFIKDWRVGGLPGEEFEEKGRDLEEGIEAAKLLVKYGYDLLDVDVGCYDAWYWNHPPMYQEKGLYRQYAKMVKEAVDVPVICAGRMDNPDMASAAIADGTCDIIGLARPLLADPDYVNKLRADDVAAIRPCLSCHEGCLGRMIHFQQISCAVNAACSRERYARLIPAVEKKRIAVIGGGPGGMEVARVAAVRGHEVVLFEAREQLGGNLVPGGAPAFKEDDRALVAWYAEQLKRLNVEVKLGMAVAAEDVAEGYDAVVVATGSTPKTLDVEGLPVVTAEEVLLGTVDPGEEAIIIGGGLVGCETALHLADSGKKVRLVVRSGELMRKNKPLCPSNFGMLEELLPFRGVEILFHSTVERVEGDAAIIATPEGEVRVPAASVIQSVGYRSKADLYEELRYGKAPVYKIGDARKVATIMNAIWDAYELGSNL